MEETISTSSAENLRKMDAVEIPEREAENFRRKYGDNKTHLHNIRHLKVSRSEISYKFTNITHITNFRYFSLKYESENSSKNLF